jgi:hypothetical protein
MKKIKVKTIGDKVIYVDPNNGEFYRDDHLDMSLRELTRTLEEETKQEYHGTFYITSFNGIEKFEASKRFFSSYKDRWMVKGIVTDRYSSRKEDMIEEEKLFPDNEINKNLYIQCVSIIQEGWATIRRGEALKNNLTK